MPKYIVSTMSMSVNYTFYTEVKENPNVKAGSGALPNIRKQILIKGGAGLTSATSGFGEMAKGADGAPLWTPEGIVTVVSDADFEHLKEHHVFKQHLEKGLVKVVNHDIVGNHKAVAKEVRGMSDDPFAPMTRETADKRIKVKLSGEQEDDLFRV